MLSRTNIVLSVLLAIVVIVAAVSRVDYSKPNFEIYLGDDMTYSPAYGAYQPNPVFADGRTQQAPVPGTIARGEMPLHFEATPEDALRAGEALENPYEPGSDELRASAERGGNVYRIYCVACHGASGAGDGPVAARGFPPPPSLLAGKSLQMKDGQLVHILTYGQNSMPNFAAQLTLDRRWDVVNYIRSIQSQSAAAEPPMAEPKDVNGETPSEPIIVDEEPETDESHESAAEPPIAPADDTDTEPSKPNSETPESTDTTESSS